MSKTVSFSIPSDSNQGPICGVLATAIASGNNFKTAFDYYKTEKSNKWKGALFTHEIIKGIQQFGMTLENIKICNWDEKISLGETVKILKDRFPNDLFVIFVRAHVVTAYNGNIIDQQECGTADTFWCRQWKVASYQGIYRVVDAVVDASQFAVTTVLKPNLNKHMKLSADSQFKNKTQGALAIFEEYVDRGRCPKHYIDWILNDFCIKLNMKVATAKTYYYKIAKEKGYSFSRYDY